MKKHNIKLFLGTTLLCLVVCMCTFAGTTWGWFSAGNEIEVTPIVAAEWRLESVVVYQTSQPEQLIPVDETINGHVFSAAANQEYTVEVAVNATSNNGFILVEIGEQKYYTTQPTTSFRLLLSEDSNVTVSASWGFASDEAIPFLEQLPILTQVPILSDSNIPNMPSVEEAPQEPSPTPETEEIIEQSKASEEPALSEETELSDEMVIGTSDELEVPQ